MAQDVVYPGEGSMCTWEKGEIIPSIFSDHKLVRLDVNYRKKTIKNTNMWRLTTHFCSVQFSRSVVSDSLQPHKPQHSRPPCPSPAPGVHPDTMSIELVMPSNHLILCCPLLLLPSIFLKASGSFPMNQLFISGGQTIGVWVSTSVLPTSNQDWSPLGWTGWIFLQSKGLSRVFSNTTVQKHQFFCAHLFLYSNSHIHIWPLEKP